MYVCMYGYLFYVCVITPKERLHVLWMDGWMHAYVNINLKNQNITLKH